MEKIFIKNRKGQKISVVVEKSESQAGLAFVMHGLGGFKEQSHIETFAEAFKDNNFTVIRFDTTNTFGESDGKFEDATTTNYYEDLEDVISWSEEQEWYEDPFWLAGHSLGGISVALYAQKHSGKVKAVAPVSTVVSGRLSLKSPRYERSDILEKWKEKGERTYESSTKPGFMKTLKWSHMIDRQKYDLVKDADKLTMPVLLIVGEKDESTPPEHQKILYEALPGEKEIHVIKDAPHTFVKPEHLNQIKEIFNDWISKVEE